MNYKQDIPKVFYNTTEVQQIHPHAYTVGELKKILNTLPDYLKINSTFKPGVEVSVYNMDFGHKGPHLFFGEPVFDDKLDYLYAKAAEANDTADKE